MLICKQSVGIYVGVIMVDVNGAGVTGVTSPTVRLAKSGNAIAAKALVGGDWTEIEGGLYWLQLSSGDTDTVGALIGTVAKTGCVTVPLALSVQANIESDLYSRLGAPVGASLAADIAAVFAREGAPAGASLAADLAAIFARSGAPAGASLAADLAAIYAREGAPAGASLAADIASVKTSVGAVTGNVANVVAVGSGAIVAGSFAAGAIDAGAIATDAIGSAEISAAAVTKIQNGLPSGGDWSSARAAKVDRLDVVLSTRAAPTDILNDATPFAGADVGLIKKVVNAILAFIA